MNKYKKKIFLQYNTNFLINIAASYVGNVNEHVEVNADSYKGTFEDKLIVLYPHDASKRLWCENWASWPRHTFIEHLKLIYPHITNVDDKTFQLMIKDLKFEFDSDDISVDTRYISELRIITDHYDTRTSNEEVEAVKNTH